MSDQVFYVGSTKNRQLTGYVPAKFLTINGKPVVDPTPGGSQRTYIYADGSDKYKTMGAIANPNNYLIVPANYTEQQAKAFAAEVAHTLGTKGAGEAQDQMTDAFSQGGSQDVQRNPRWGIPEGSVVPAFVSSASYHLGSVTRQAGLPREWAEIGGGLKNLENRFIKQPWNYVFSKDHEWNSIDTSGPHFLSQNNYGNFSKGFADAGAANAGTSGNDYFGYNPGAQYRPGQIGDGKGLGVGDWRFPFAGIDPSNPTRPVPPLQTDSRPAPGLVRVSDNRSPAAPASSIAPSDNGNVLGDRFGKWGSAATGAAPLPASDRPESFDNRFGNWGSVPTGGLSDTGSPVLRTLERYQRSALPDGASSSSGHATDPATNLPGEESTFGDRSGNAPNAPGPDNYPLRRVSSAFPDIAPLSPKQPASPPERTPPLGVVSGKPMAQFLLPPSVWGLPDKSDASGNDDRFASLAGIAPKKPLRPTPPPGASKPERYLSPRIVGQSQAPVPDASEPAAPVAPSNEPKFFGGLLGRLAALMGVDPENPTQLAPPPLDDQLRGFYRDDPLQPWFVQGSRQA